MLCVLSDLIHHSPKNQSHGSVSKIRLNAASANNTAEAAPANTSAEAETEQVNSKTKVC